MAAAASAQPPARLSTVRTSRPRAGRWLPGPSGSFVAARARSGLVSGLRHASDDTPMPAAVSGTGRGRGGSPPPPGLSADPSRRPRAGRWLPNPPGLFVGARGRGCLASGVPHALGDAVMPAAPGRARSGLVVSNVRRSRPVVSAPNHHPAERASSAATAKPPISRAIRQGGKGRPIRTAKSPAIGESLADESWPADPFRNRPLAAWARPVYNTYRLSQNGRLPTGSRPERAHWPASQQPPMRGLRFWQAASTCSGFQ